MIVIVRQRTHELGLGGECHQGEAMPTALLDGVTELFQRLFAALEAIGKDVFCHQLREWPPEAEVIEDMPQYSCAPTVMKSITFAVVRPSASR